MLFRTDETPAPCSMTLWNWIWEGEPTVQGPSVRRIAWRCARRNLLLKVLWKERQPASRRSEITAIRSPFQCSVVIGAITSDEHF